MSMIAPMMAMIRPETRTKRWPGPPDTGTSGVVVLVVVVLLMSAPALVVVPRPSGSTSLLRRVVVEQFRRVSRASQRPRGRRLRPRFIQEEGAPLRGQFRSRPVTFNECSWAGGRVSRWCGRAPIRPAGDPAGPSVGASAGSRLDDARARR